MAGSQEFFRQSINRIRSSTSRAEVVDLTLSSFHRWEKMKTHPEVSSLWLPGIALLAMLPDQNIEKLQWELPMSRKHLDFLTEAAGDGTYIRYLNEFDGQPDMTHSVSRRNMLNRYGLYWFGLQEGLASEYFNVSLSGLRQGIRRTSKKLWEHSATETKDKFDGTSPLMIVRRPSGMGTVLKAVHEGKTFREIQEDDTMPHFDRKTVKRRAVKEGIRVLPDMPSLRYRSKWMVTLKEIELAADSQERIAALTKVDPRMLVWAMRQKNPYFLTFSQVVGHKIGRAGKKIEEELMTHGVATGYVDFPPTIRGGKKVIDRKHFIYAPDREKAYSIIWENEDLRRRLGLEKEDRQPAPAKQLALLPQ